VAPSPTATPEPLFFFWGRGTDHGVGMSQWGARGRALAGQTYDQILNFYYTNIQIATIDGTTPIRVRIGSDFMPEPGCPARLTSVAGDWTSSAFGAQTFSVGSYLEMWPDAMAPTPPVPPTQPGTPVGWTAIVYSAQGTELARTPTRDASMESLSDATGVIKVSFKDSYPNMNQFRDSVRLLVNADGSLDQVNTLPLDYYLLGVVPSEMPGSWHLEAVKAQAVAARSYAWPRIDGDGYFDIGASSASQNYKGFLHEYPNTNRAVLDTAGQVITYNGKVVAAYYHSSSGGHTENTEYAFVTAAGNPGSVVGYCRGKPDVDANGLAYDRNSSDYYWESASFTMSQLSAIMAKNDRTNVGQILELTFNRGVSGRAYQVVMTGTLGTKNVSGGTFSGTFNKNRPGGSPVTSNMFYLTPVGQGPGG
jgi:SpoIID/LytB domain protein